MPQAWMRVGDPRSEVDQSLEVKEVLCVRTARLFGECSRPENGISGEDSQMFLKRETHGEIKLVADMFP